MHGRDHVKLFERLASFRRKLPCVRRILHNLVDDHVKPVFEPFKHRRDHVKLRPELPCPDAITSNFLWNFLAQTRSSCDRCFAFVTCNFCWNVWTCTGRKTHQWWVSLCEIRNLCWANGGNSCRSARCLCLVCGDKLWPCGRCLR